jgi:glycosyltransferase involved in cell wall biosynthesis
MKPMFIVSCPIDTYSGYGARARDFVKALIELDEYDVKVLPQRWGETPWGFIEAHSEWHFLTPHLLPVGNQLPKQPEIWCQITIPNEFQPVGKFNIGLTAGIETTGCHPTWIEGCNRMDLILGSSTHSIEVLKTIKFEQRNQQTNEVMGQYGLQKPIEVLIEGADLETYQPKKSNFDLDQVEEEFAYLFVGHWMQGNIGEDRKNVGLLVRLFFEAFKNKKKTPALILKTTAVGTSYMDRNEILNRIDMIRNSVEDARTLPNIYLLQGEFTNEEVNDLYTHNKVKAMVNLTKGEGFGRPLLEFSLSKKPIITTNWSGHTDFLSNEFTSLLPGKLTNIHPSAVAKDIIMEEFQWFSVDNNAVILALRDVFTNYKNYKEKATRQAYKSRTDFSYEKMVEQLKGYLGQYVPEFPKEVKLELPKLNLPKLKKIENDKG